MYPDRPNISPVIVTFKLINLLRKSYYFDPGRQPRGAMVGPEGGKWRHTILLYMVNWMQTDRDRDISNLTSRRRIFDRWITGNFWYVANWTAIRHPSHAKIKHLLCHWLNFDAWQKKPGGNNYYVRFYVAFTVKLPIIVHGPVSLMGRGV